MLVRITENVVGCTIVTPKKSQSHDRYKKLLCMAIFEYDMSLNGIENSSYNFEKKVVKKNGFFGIFWSDFHFLNRLSMHWRSKTFLMCS